MAQYADLTMEQGIDYGQDFIVRNPDGTPRDITYSSFTMSMRKSHFSKAITANMVMTIADGVNGILYANANTMITSNIKAGYYVYDIREVNSSNLVSRLAEGTIIVYPQVTK